MFFVTLSFFNSLYAAFLEASVLIKFSIPCVIRGVVTNSGLGGEGGAGSIRYLFCIVKYEGGIKESNVSSSC